MVFEKVWENIWKNYFFIKMIQFSRKKFDERILLFDCIVTMIEMRGYGIRQSYAADLCSKLVEPWFLG